MRTGRSSSDPADHHAVKSIWVEFQTDLQGFLFLKGREATVLPLEMTFLTDFAPCTTLFRTPLTAFPTLEAAETTDAELDNRTVRLERVEAAIEELVETVSAFLLAMLRGEKVVLRICLILRQLKYFCGVQNESNNLRPTDEDRICDSH